MLLRNYLLSLVNKAKSNNDKNIFSLLEENNKANLLDLGCADGEWTLKLGEAVGTKNLFGIELSTNLASESVKKNIQCVVSNLNDNFPFTDNFFDIIHANQVIEHLFDLEKFINEIFRVLKPDGYVIISTENLASWHNVFSLLFGWQPFSTTNYTLKALGNPLSLWKNHPTTVEKSWCHSNLWAYRGLIEFFESYNFKVKKIMGAGYYPLPSFLGNIDKRHCHWISLKIAKI